MSQKRCTKLCNILQSIDRQEPISLCANIADNLDNLLMYVKHSMYSDIFKEPLANSSVMGTYYVLIATVIIQYIIIPCKVACGAESIPCRYTQYSVIWNIHICDHHASP